MIDTKRRSPHRPSVVAAVALGPVVLAWIAALASPIPFAVGDALLALGIVVFFVVLYATTMRPDGAGRWARQRGADFDPDVQAVLAWHLTRTRVARALGVTLGLAIPTMMMARYNADPESFEWYVDEWGATNPYWPPGLGYLIGSVWAELTKPRPSSPVSGRAAILSPRRLSDFLDPFVHRALVIFGALGLTGCVVAAVLLTFTDRQLAMEFGVVHGAVAATVSVTALAAATLVARRTERADDNVSLAYEELTRTATVNALAGVAVAMLGYVALGVSTLGGDPAAVPGWMQLAIFLVSFGGLLVWVTSGTSLVFRSHRLDRIRSGR